MELNEIIDFNRHQITAKEFKKNSREKFDRDGLLILTNFLTDNAIDVIYQEGVENQDKAYFCENWHNVYLMPSDPEYNEEHPRNKNILSSKGCITDDQISKNSILRTIYNSQEFKEFLIDILDEEALFPYADHMSSINLHYAKTGQELGWHFDNSSFAITLMIQPAIEGGEFEYVRRVRDAENGEMNFSVTDDIISGKTIPNKLAQSAGALVLFRGRNAIHRVTANLGEETRMLVVLAYNNEPGIALSETAAKTFYGRS